MLVQPIRRLPNRATVKYANKRNNVDYAMLATLRIVLDEPTSVHSNGAVASKPETTSNTHPRRLHRLFHSVRMAWPRPSSQIAA